MTNPTTQRLLIAWVLGICLLLTSCVVTPVPEPPNIDPPEAEDIMAEIRFTALFVTIFLEGAPGSVEPGSRLWVANLDDPLAPPPDEFDVEDDGSFSAEVNGEDGDMVRLQVRREEQRSEPLDAIVRDLSTLVAVERQTCLELRPSLELALGDVGVDDSVTGEIFIDNNCAEPVDLEALSFRRDEAGLEVLTDPPLTIPEDATAQVEVRCTPESAALAEDILFVELGAPVSIRWPVTIFCIGR